MYGVHTGSLDYLSTMYLVAYYIAALALHRTITKYIQGTLYKVLCTGYEVQGYIVQGTMYICMYVHSTIYEM